MSYIEYSDENGTYRITRDCGPTINDVVEDLVIPVLLAAGYTRDSIETIFDVEG